MNNTITILGRMYSSKNSKQIKKFNRKKEDIAADLANGVPLEKVKRHRTILAKSDKAYAQETAILLQLKDATARHTWKELTAGLEYPYEVFITYYPPDEREWDYMNIFQNLFDMMQKAGYIPNDSFKYVVPVFNKQVIVDARNPRTEFTILRGPIPCGCVKTLMHGQKESTCCSQCGKPLVGQWNTL